MEDLIFKDIPAWYAYAIVPIAFVLMAYRFILAAGSQALRIIGVLDEPAEDAS